jgi:hypothetical protein
MEMQCGKKRVSEKIKERRHFYVTKVEEWSRVLGNLVT